jgi:hypothetical protein
MRRLGIALALLALSGCGDDDGTAREPSPPVPTAQPCTEIGCLDSVEVDVNRAPRGARVTLCIDGRCQPAQTASPVIYSVRGPLERSSGDAVRVSITVRKGGRTIARETKRFAVQTDRPNGPNCPPVCRFVHASFDLPSRTLRQS